MTDKKRKRKRKRKSKIYLEEKLIVCKCKSIQISNQEHNKMIQRISSRVPIPIKPLTLVKNVSPQFDWIVIAWTRKVQAGEEP